MEAEWVNIGDTHWEKLRNLFPIDGGMGYQEQAYNHVLQYARSKGVTTAVHLGDIYDNPHPDQATQVAFAQINNKNKDIQINMIPGNHDFEDIENDGLKIFQGYSKLGALPNCKLYKGKPKLQDIEGIPVCYLPYPHTEVPQDAGPRVVFAHCEFSGAIRDSGMVVPKESGLRIPTDSDNYWIVGHLHTYHRLGKRVIYPGTMLQLNFGERLPKGFVHTRATFRKGKLSVEHQFIPYETPYQLHNIQVKSIDDLKQVKLSNKHFYKLILHDKISIPPNWFVDHPNVLKHEGVSLKATKIDGKKVLVAESIMDPKDGLNIFCKKHELSKKHSRLAHKFVEKTLRTKNAKNANR